MRHRKRESFEKSGAEANADQHGSASGDYKQSSEFKEREPDRSNPIRVPLNKRSETDFMHGTAHDYTASEGNMFAPVWVGGFKSHRLGALDFLFVL